MAFVLIYHQTKLFHIEPVMLSFRCAKIISYFITFNNLYIFNCFLIIYASIKL